MIKRFSLPGYYKKYPYIVDFLNYYYEHRNQFYEDRLIESVYDAHFDILWNGGREIDLNQQYIPMIYILRDFEQFPLELWHVCTNCLIDDEVCMDYRSNYFMKNHIRENDKVIINHPRLIEHFQKNYPNIELIYSTTLNLTSIEKMNEISKDNLYCLTYIFNNNNDFLQQLMNKKNIEILCAEPCLYNCPQRKNHQEATSRLSLGDFKTGWFKCIDDKIGEKLFYDIQNMPQAITNERIEELSNMGFEHFKLSGRSISVSNWLEVLLYYLAKPEYIDRIRLYLIHLWWQV